MLRDSIELSCEAIARSALGPSPNKRGAEFLYRCPRHDDRHPSLQINVDKDVWLCGPCGASGSAWQLAAFLAECDPSNKQAVRAWLAQHGLLKRGPRAKNSLHSQGVKVATYSYTDPDGRLLYEKVRYEPKGFAIRRPDGNGGWLWGLGGVVPVLYNLPKVVKAREVLYVEGEKDVETARRLGLVATTSGSVTSWRKEFAEVFRGRAVSIVADSDEPGRKHAQQVAADLVGAAETVKLLELPGAKDLTEWVEHGGTREALIELLNAAPTLIAEDVAGLGKEKVHSGWQAQTVAEMLEQTGLAKLEKGAPIEEVELALRNIAVSANGVDPLRRIALRSAVMECLAKAGVNSPARFVDAAIKESRIDSGTEQGSEVLFTDPEPWPDSVDGNHLLLEIGVLLQRFSVVPRGGATAISLWIVHTYALAAAYISPILAIVSPEKRCGKTVLLGILYRIVWRPLTAANITAASLFRSVEKWTPTLLIDEADSFLMGNDELRGVLNSGHRRDTAKVIRTAGDEHEPRVFSTWGAKAIAQIGKPPATLEDRAIVLQMKRKNPGEPVEWFRPERKSAELEVLRRKIMRWAADNLEVLREADPQIPDGLHDRAADNWRPLLAIADAAGGPWPELARRDALLLSGPESTEENSAGVQLLADLRHLFREMKVGFLASETVVQELNGLEERPWAEWKKGKPITKVQVASLLRKFGVRPKQTWLKGQAERGYELADFHDPFSRYLPSETVESVGANIDRGLSENSGSVGKAIPTDSKIRPKGPSIKESTESTDSKPRYEVSDGQHEACQDGLEFFGEGESLLPQEPDYGEV